MTPPLSRDALREVRRPVLAAETWRIRDRAGSILGRTVMVQELNGKWAALGPNEELDANLGMVTVRAALRETEGAT